MWHFSIGALYYWRTLFCSPPAQAFWNHLSGTVTQPWSSFFFLGAGVAVVQASNLSTLASGNVDRNVQFCHLSFQEYMSAEFLALVSRDISELGAWLRAGAGDPWWSQVLLMTTELLPPAQCGSLLDALALTTDNRYHRAEDENSTRI